MARQARTRQPGKYAEKKKREVPCTLCGAATKNYTAKRLPNAKIAFIGACCDTN